MTPRTPPAQPVRWEVYAVGPVVDEYLGEVVAQFWSEARALASAKFGVEPNLLIVEAIDEGEGGDP